MKSSMSIDLALFSLKPASCKTLSIFLLMLKSAGTSCRDQTKFKITRPEKRRLLGSSTHHIVNRTVNPVVLLQQLLHCCWSTITKSLDSIFFFGQNSSRSLTWKLHSGFCSFVQKQFWPDRPTPVERGYKWNKLSRRAPSGDELTSPENSQEEGGFWALFEQRWTPLWEEAENYSSPPDKRRKIK